MNNLIKTIGLAGILSFLPLKEINAQNNLDKKNKEYELSFDNISYKEFFTKKYYETWGKIKNFGTFQSETKWNFDKLSKTYILFLSGNNEKKSLRVYVTPVPNFIDNDLAGYTLSDVHKVSSSSKKEIYIQLNKLLDNQLIQKKAIEESGIYMKKLMKAKKSLDNFYNENE